MAQRNLVNWTKDGQVATITINNPPANVISRSVTDDLSDCLDEIAADDGVVTVVVTGAGERFFMAGADIKEFPELMKPTVAAGFALRLDEVYNKLDSLPKPTIAAVNGMALGGGCELAMACDIRVASEDAQFGQPEIKLGLIPGAGGTQRLPRLVGEGKAKELMYIGDPIDAQVALAIGLVNKVVPKGQALAAAQEMAQLIASRAGVALRMIKQAVDQGLDMPLFDGTRIEAELFGKVFVTEDVKEGVDAFLKKRPPAFKHR